MSFGLGISSQMRNCGRLGGARGVGSAAANGKLFSRGRLIKTLHALPENDLSGDSKFVEWNARIAVGLRVSRSPMRGLRADPGQPVCQAMERNHDPPEIPAWKLHPLPNPQFALVKSCPVV
jgi:hypothetical protein